MFALRRLMMGTAIIEFIATAQYLPAHPPKPNGSNSRSRTVSRKNCWLKRLPHARLHANGGGKIAEEQWLTGDQLGWRGPWGTTYPGNLRLYMQNFSEEQWVKIAKTAQFRPPMPWFNLHAMTTQDLRAIYRFIRHLGPAGQPAPAFVPASQEPEGPYVQIPQPPE